MATYQAPSKAGVDAETTLQIYRLSSAAVLQVLRAALERGPFAVSNKPQGCSILIMGCVSISSHRPRPMPPALVDLKLQAMMSFVARPLTTEDLVETERCTCAARPALDNDNARLLHRYATQYLAGLPEVDKDPLDIAVSTMCSDLAEAIEITIQTQGSVYKVSRNAQRATRRGTVLHFPKAPFDLFPFDPTACIDSLLRWLARSNLPLPIFNLLTRVVEVCVSEGIPALIASRYFMLAIEFLAGSALDDARRKETYTKGWEQLNNLATFLDFLRKYALSSVEFVLCVTARDDYTFLRICSDILSASDSMTEIPDASELAGTVADIFLTIGVELHQVLPLLADAPRFHPKILAASATKNDAYRRGRIATLACVQMTIGHRCFSPSCTTTQSRVQRKFMQCSGCCLTPYCSKKCQQSAWRHPAVPHREICRSLPYILRIPHRDHGSEQAEVDMVHRVAKQMETLFVLKVEAMESDPLFGEQIREKLTRYKQRLLR